MYFELVTRCGPAIGNPKAKGELSFGSLSVAVLTGVLRPWLAKWHPLLVAHGARRAHDVSPLDHERAWDKEEELRTEILGVRKAIGAYADLLAEVAGVKPLRWTDKRSA